MRIDRGLIWQFLLPLLFLPNLGLARETSFGVLEISDIFILPLIAALLIAPSRRYVPRSAVVERVFGAFLLWSTTSTLLITGRYHYLDDYYLRFGLLKLGKLALYVVAGLLIVRALRDESARQRYPALLAVCAGVTSVALILQGPDASSSQGFKATNGISVMLAILVSFLVAMWVDGLVGTRMKRAIAALILVSVYGLVFTDGRGGWVAAGVALAFILSQRIHSKRTWLAITASTLLALGLYRYQPEFHRQVHNVLFEQAINDYGQDVGSGLPLNDGARLWTWKEEIRKFPRSPLLGTGFYHRSGSSGLWATGSHNFFLQMFLETGLVGGALWIIALLIMWRQGGRSPTFRLPARAALVAVAVGGMSGEYFYGGVILITLLLVYAPVGYEPKASTGSILRHSVVAATAFSVPRAATRGNR